MKPRLFDHLDAEWLTHKALELVAIKSETLDESEICRTFLRELEDLGLEVFTREVSEKRFNVYGKLSGQSDATSLILNGHLDTIPIGNSWPPRIEGSKLFGRGAEDMKGGMASLLAMVRSLRSSNTRLNGDLWITAVVGHEDVEAQKDGPLAMCEDINSGLISGDAIVIAEGDSELWTMSTGSAVFRIHLKSHLQGTHTNNITFAVNPVRFVAKVIDTLYQLQTDMDRAPGHPLAGTERIDIGVIKVGDYYNRTPEHSVIEGIVRWLPGNSEHAMKQIITDLVAPIAREGDLELSVELLMTREPFETPISNPVLQSALRASVAATGHQAKIIGKRIVGDANIFVAKTGIPSFYFGPGYRSAHSNDEWVDVDDLLMNAKFYGALVSDYLGEV